MVVWDWDELLLYHPSVGPGWKHHHLPTCPETFHRISISNIEYSFLLHLSTWSEELVILYQFDNIKEHSNMYTKSKIAWPIWVIVLIFEANCLLSKVQLTYPNYPELAKAKLSKSCLFKKYFLLAFSLIICIIGSRWTMKQNIWRCCMSL